MDFKELLAAVRAAWWLPVLGVILGALAGLGLNMSQTPTYTASLQLFVSARASASTDVYTGFLISQQRVKSYVELLSGEQLAQRIVRGSRLDIAPAAVASEISANNNTDTVLIDVSVVDQSPQRAAAIAKAVGEKFPAFVNDLEDNGTGSLVKVTVTQEPTIPTSASSPRVTRNITVGVLIGLVLGVALAALRTRLDRSIKQSEEARQLAGAPVLGLIPQDKNLEKTHVIDRSAPNRTAEGYRQLRANLQFLNVDNPPKVIMVSSPLPSEGKTTLVVNLAIALADVGRSVVIIEGDLRRPKVIRYLGLVSGAGLTNVLVAGADLEEVVQHYGSSKLAVVGAGPLPPNPGELLASSQMLALLNRLRSENDYVLIDAPPVLPVADAAGMAVHTDGVLLSVRYGQTRKDHLRQTATTIQNVGATVLGVILNVVPPKTQEASLHGYGATYSYVSEISASNGVSSRQEEHLPKTGRH